jgi:hypothetical protein
MVGSDRRADFWINKGFRAELARLPDDG